MTTLRLPLAIALLSLAACVVKTDELKPKTDAECAALGEKACGYKCVAVDDPASGCGEDRCTPCPANGLPHMVAACDTSDACGNACAAGWGDCNGGNDGCEISLLDDPLNCGACGRTCPGSCSLGACAPLVQLYTTGFEPRGMVNHRGNLYFVQWSSDVYQQALRRAGDGAHLAEQLGDVRWLASDPISDRIWMTASWPTGGSPGFELGIVGIDPGPLNGYWFPVLEPIASSEYLDGIAATSGPVLFTSSQDRNLFVFDPWAAPPTTTNIGLLATSGQPKGIAHVSALSRSFYVFGYSDFGGTISMVEDVAGVISGEGVAAGFFVGTPSRLTAWVDPYNPANVHLFWASEDDGSVWESPFGDWSKARQIAPPTGPTSLMDITADDDGVYWTNRSTGLVRMWSVRWGTAVTLARSTSPFGTASDGSRIYWSDDVDQAIYWTTKYY